LNRSGLSIYESRSLKRPALYYFGVNMAEPLEHLISIGVKLDGNWASIKGNITKYVTEAQNAAIFNLKINKLTQADLNKALEFTRKGQTLTREIALKGKVISLNTTPVKGTSVELSGIVTNITSIRPTPTALTSLQKDIKTAVKSAVIAGITDGMATGGFGKGSASRGVRGPSRPGSRSASILAGTSGAYDSPSAERIAEARKLSGAVTRRTLAELKAAAAAEEAARTSEALSRSNNADIAANNRRTQRSNRDINARPAPGEILNPDAAGNLQQGSVKPLTGWNVRRVQPIPLSPKREVSILTAAEKTSGRYGGANAALSGFRSAVAAREESLRAARIAAMSEQQQKKDNYEKDRAATLARREAKAAQAAESGGAPARTATYPYMPKGGQYGPAWARAPFIPTSGRGAGYYSPINASQAALAGGRVSERFTRRGDRAGVFGINNFYTDSELKKLVANARSRDLRAFQGGLGERIPELGYQSRLGAAVRGRTRNLADAAAESTALFKERFVRPQDQAQRGVNWAITSPQMKGMLATGIQQAAGMGLPTALLEPLVRSAQWDLTRTVQGMNLPKRQVEGGSNQPVIGGRGGLPYSVPETSSKPSMERLFASTVERAIAKLERLIARGALPTKGGTGSTNVEKAAMAQAVTYATREERRLALLRGGKLEQAVGAQPAEGPGKRAPGRPTAEEAKAALIARGPVLSDQRKQEISDAKGAVERSKTERTFWANQQASENFRNLTAKEQAKVEKSVLYWTRKVEEAKKKLAALTQDAASRSASISMKGQRYGAPSTATLSDQMRTAAGGLALGPGQDRSAVSGLVSLLPRLNSQFGNLVAQMGRVNFKFLGIDKEGNYTGAGTSGTRLTPSGRETDLAFATALKAKEGRVVQSDPRSINAVLRDLTHEASHAVANPAELRTPDRTGGWRTVMSEVLADYGQMATMPKVGSSLGLTAAQAEPGLGTNYLGAMIGNQNWMAKQAAFQKDMSFLASKGMGIGGKPGTGIAGLDPNNIQQLKSLFAWISRYAPQMTAFRGGPAGTVGVRREAQQLFQSQYEKTDFSGLTTPGAGNLRLAMREAVQVSGGGRGIPVEPMPASLDSVERASAQRAQRAMVSQLRTELTRAYTGIVDSTDQATSGLLTRQKLALQNARTAVTQRLSPEATAQQRERLKQGFAETGKGGELALLRTAGVSKQSPLYQPALDLNKSMGQFDYMKYARLEALGPGGRGKSQEASFNAMQRELNETAAALAKLRKAAEGAARQETIRRKGAILRPTAELTPAEMAAATATTTSKAGSILSRFNLGAAKRRLEEQDYVGSGGEVNRRPFAQSGILSKFGVARQESSRQPGEHAFGRLGSTFSNLATWSLVGGAIYQVRAAVTSLVSTLKAADTQMTQINRILQTSSAELNNLRTNLLEVGVEYGRSFENVADLAEEYAKQGYTGDQLVERTRAATLAMNVSGMEAIATVKTLTAAQSQLQLTDEQATSLVDKWTAVSQAQRVSYKDVASGVAQVGGLAKEAGFSVDQLNALLASTGAVSGETGETIGSAMRTIINRVSVPTAPIREDFSQVGIDVDKYIGNVPGLLDQIVSKWDSWNEQQRLTIAKAAAEKRRAAIFIDMIRAYKDADKYGKAYQAGLSSEGAAERANAEIMKSYAKKIESVKIEFQKLAVAIGEAGLMSVLKGFLTIAAKAFGLFTGLPKPIAKAFIALGGAITAVFGAKILAGLMGFNIGFAKVGQSAIGAAGAMVEMTEAEVAASSAASVLNVLLGAQVGAFGNAAAAATAYAGAVSRSASASVASTAVSGTMSATLATEGVLGGINAANASRGGTRAAEMKKISNTLVQSGMARDWAGGAAGPEGQAIAAQLGYGPEVLAGNASPIPGLSLRGTTTNLDRLSKASGNMASVVPVVTEGFERLEGATRSQLLAFLDSTEQIKTWGQRQSLAGTSTEGLRAMAIGWRENKELGGTVGAVANRATRNQNLTQFFGELTRNPAVIGSRKDRGLQPGVKGWWSGTSKAFFDLNSETSKTSRSISWFRRSMASVTNGVTGFASGISAIIGGINPVILALGAFLTVIGALISIDQKRAKANQEVFKNDASMAARYAELYNKSVKGGGASSALSLDEQKEARLLGIKLSSMYPDEVKNNGTNNPNAELPDIMTDHIRNSATKAIEENQGFLSNLWDSLGVGTPKVGKWYNTKPGIQFLSGPELGTQLRETTAANKPITSNKDLLTYAKGAAGISNQLSDLITGAQSTLELSDIGQEIKAFTENPESYLSGQVDMAAKDRTKVYNAIVGGIQKTGLPQATMATTLSQGYLRGGVNTVAPRDVKGLAPVLEELARGEMQVPSKVEAQTVINNAEEDILSFVDQIKTATDRLKEFSVGLDIAASYTTSPIMGVQQRMQKNLMGVVNNSVMGKTTMDDLDKAIKGLDDWMTQQQKMYTGSVFAGGLGGPQSFNKPAQYSPISQGYIEKYGRAGANRRGEARATAEEARLSTLQGYNERWNEIMGAFLEAWGAQVEQARSTAESNKNYYEMGTQAKAGDAERYNLFGTRFGPGAAGRVSSIKQGSVVKQKADIDSLIKAGRGTEAAAAFEILGKTMQEQAAASDAQITEEQKIKEDQKAAAEKRKQLYSEWLGNMQSYLDFLKSTEKIDVQQYYLLAKRLEKYAKTPDQIKQAQQAVFEAYQAVMDDRYSNAEGWISHYSALDQLGPEQLVPVYQKLLTDARAQKDTERIWEYEEKLFQAQRDLLEQKNNSFNELAKKIFSRAAGKGGPLTISSAEYNAALGGGTKSPEIKKMAKPVDELVAYLRSKSGDIRDQVKGDTNKAWLSMKRYADQLLAESKARDAVNVEVLKNTKTINDNKTIWESLNKQIIDLVDPTLGRLIAKMSEVDKKWFTENFLGGTGSGESKALPSLYQILGNVGKGSKIDPEGLEKYLEPGVEKGSYKGILAAMIEFNSIYGFGGIPYGGAGRDADPSTFKPGSFSMPVPGGTASDTWGADRSGGKRRHQGTDIFANLGTSVKALTSGVATPGTDSLGGNVVRLRGDNGSYFYYAHLSKMLPESKRVKYGEWLGAVGATGNAAGTDPHLHLQYKPKGSGWVNPFELLQRYKVNRLYAQGKTALTGGARTQFVRHQGGIMGSPDTFTTTLQKGETVVPRSETPMLFGILDRLSTVLNAPTTANNGPINIEINLTNADGTTKTVTGTINPQSGVKSRLDRRL
jgi:TP901 family phage tail tape measure protein